jgi:hypothetical protein
MLGPKKKEMKENRTKLGWNSWRMAWEKNIKKKINANKDEIFTVKRRSRCRNRIRKGEADHLVGSTRWKFLLQTKEQPTGRFFNVVISNVPHLYFDSRSGPTFWREVKDDQTVTDRQWWNGDARNGWISKFGDPCIVLRASLKAPLP